MTKHQSVDRIQDTYKTSALNKFDTKNAKSTEQIHSASTGDLMIERPMSRKDDSQRQLPPMSQSISMAILNENKNSKL